MSSICLSVPRESSYNLPPIPTSQLDFDGTYIGPDPTPHLWPPGPRDKAPGSIRSVTAEFGQGLDRGALRRLPSGRWEIREFGPMWLSWKPSIESLRLAACAFNRYGVGWSFGPAHNLHDEAYGKWEELCGSPPEQIQKWDIDYSLQLWRQLDSEWKLKFGQMLEPQEPQEPTKPVEPIKPIELTKPVEPVKPIEPGPQEPSMPTLAVDLSAYIPDLKQHITSTIESLRKDLMRDIDAEVDASILRERQWWHDNIQPLVDDFMTKRPALAERLGRLLKERKLD